MHKVSLLLQRSTVHCRQCERYHNDPII
uniref:Uncharacterized protein n=1 Tax=Rhizophora mucronata TaxID=61149 RepID=A0A2P2NSW5_RHIMU